jgi:transcriptional regulator with XRE-family HTH domain
MSFQITISPKERAAGRFISRVRRAIQKALAEEEKKNGTSQSDLARTLGINRSVISREIRGNQDLTLSRVAELAWALGRKPKFELVEVSQTEGSNWSISTPPAATTDKGALTNNPRLSINAGTTQSNLSSYITVASN